MTNIVDKRFTDKIIFYRWTVNLFFDTIVLGDLMLYSSIDNKKIKELKKLSLKKYRDLESLFLVEGEHLINEAYNSGYLKELLLEEGFDYELNIPTNYVSSNVMKYLSELDTPTKMIGVCKKRKSEISGNKILILDDVQDPGNVGTIIRSAVAFNVDTIILSKGCADIYSSKVIRSSQGMLFKINILYTDLKDCIESLKEKDYQIIGTSLKEGKELKSIYKKDKFVIIMGNEGNGVKDELLDLCDERIYIKMNEKCESLNVGVATGIILYWGD